VNYEIKLPLFEGPFDLLLFFIERDELDVYDIPIFKITNDFLDYIHQMEAMNIELASEFILVAATLMSIKAKMLLPRPELDEKGKEIDPREDLVKHLLEYKKYKTVIGELAKLEADRLAKEKRGNIVAELKQLAEVNDVESELQDIDLYKLLKVYEKVIKKFEFEQNKPIHRVVQYAYDLDEVKENIKSRLQTESRVSFIQLFEENFDKIYIIFNFLAILELLQMRKISISVGEGFNNFWVEPLAKEELNDETSVENTENNDLQ
jgi:segregation and condensation protein A